MSNRGLMPSSFDEGRNHALRTSIRARITANLRTRQGFSLLELLVVIGVVLLLTSLMMPAMRMARESANRVVCLSHLQQMGQAFMMYGNDHNDKLPYSATLREFHTPQDLMVAMTTGVNGKSSQWDGFGVLYAMGYCTVPECFYCPSHHGDHPLERYEDLWRRPRGGRKIFTNYHYAGDVEWTNLSALASEDDEPPPIIRRTLLAGYDLVLATDGLRTALDFNHVTGLNVLRGDGSAHWKDDTLDIYQRLPTALGGEEPHPSPGIWNDLHK